MDIDTKKVRFFKVCEVLVKHKYKLGVINDQDTYVLIEFIRDTVNLANVSLSTAVNTAKLLEIEDQLPEHLVENWRYIYDTIMMLTKD